MEGSPALEQLHNSLGGISNFAKSAENALYNLRRRSSNSDFPGLDIQKIGYQTFKIFHEMKGIALQIEAASYYGQTDDVDEVKKENDV